MTFSAVVTDVPESHDKLIAEVLQAAINDYVYTCKKYNYLQFQVDQGQAQWCTNMRLAQVDVEHQSSPPSAFLEYLADQ